MRKSEHHFTSLVLKSVSSTFTLAVLLWCNKWLTSADLLKLWMSLGMQYGPSVCLPTTMKGKEDTQMCDA